MSRIIRRYALESPKLEKEMTVALVSDLHNGDCSDLFPTIRQTDLILMPGDLVNRHRHGITQATRFLMAMQGKMVIVSGGNHEVKSPEGPLILELAARLGCIVLEDSMITVEGITIAGLTSRLALPELPTVADQLARMTGFRILLCHQPEYYAALVRGKDIDLTVSGHAHGGQIRIAGHGLYAPGQGLLPKFTRGFYDKGHLLVSAGIVNSALAPRWGNPTELVLLTLKPGKEFSAYEL